MGLKTGNWPGIGLIEILQLQQLINVPKPHNTHRKSQRGVQMGKMKITMV